MKKRIFSLLLTVCMLLGLSGCTTDKTKDRVQITWYMPGDDVELYNRMKGVLAIEEATGIDVVFECPPSNSEDAFKMMVASGKLPDVIMWEHSSGIDRMYEDGTVLDLTELIAEHAPNLTKIYTERPELRKEVETSDGRLYYFPSINPMQTVEEICRKSYQGFIIRDDWLNKLGLECPSTIEEWYAVLTAFKTGDPNGNGVQDEIPFDGESLSYFAPAFGILDTFCVKTDGTVAFGPMEQGYKAWLETMNKWYAEGLLGSNCLIHSDSWVSENIVNNLTGSFIGLDNAWRYYLPEMQKNMPGASLLAVPWPANTQTGDRYTPREEMAGHMASTVTVITSSCKNPAAAVKFIDYMYSEEGSNLLTWGVEGETWEWVKGKKQLTDLALERDPEKGWLNLYNYAIGHSPFPKYDGETVVLASYPEDQLVAERTWAEASAALIYPPYIPISVEDKAFCDEVMDDVDIYITEMVIKFITGEELLSNYDAFVAQLDRMGVNQALEIYRKAYEAYMAQ